MLREAAITKGRALQKGEYVNEKHLTDLEKNVEFRAFAGIADALCDNLSEKMERIMEE